MLVYGIQKRLVLSMLVCDHLRTVLLKQLATDALTMRDIEIESEKKLTA